MKKNNIIFKHFLNYNILISIVIIISIIYRLVSIPNIPGINGDEAFYGVKALNLINFRETSWITGTYLPLNPLFIIPSIIFNLLGNNFLILRLPSVITGILSIIVSFFLLKNIFSKNLAFIMTLIISVLPLNIAYSRFSWDSSQTVMISLICIYFSWKEKFIWSIISFLVAVMVHPTNVFLLPIVFGLCTFSIFKKMKKKLLVAWFVLCVIIIITVTTIVSGKTLPTNSISFKFDWVLLYRYSICIINILNGLSIYDHIASKVPTSANWAVFCFSLLYFIISIAGIILIFLKHRILTRSFSFIIYFIFSFILFAYIAGSRAIQPGYERYCLWTVAPIVVLSVLGIYYFFLITKLYKLLKPFFILISTLLLITFYYFYFMPITSGNKFTHPTFWTGEIEPKQAAFDFIKQRRDTNKNTIVFTENWWIYWPVKYLSMRESPSMYITIYGRPWDERFGKDYILPELKTSDCEIYFVGFDNGKFENYFSKLNNKNIKFKKINGYNEKPIISIFYYNSE